MFSGPDFIYANAFYPKAKTYVLSGLEPVGAVPDLTTLRGSLAPDLSALRNSLRWLLQHSYFITSQMGSDLHRGRMNGTLPVLYVFLARSGHTIREVTRSGSTRTARCSPIARAGAGSRPAASRSCSPATTASRARSITSAPIFPTGASPTASSWISARRLAPGDSLVKSASYLLHNPGFSKVREFLLGQ